MAPNRQGRKIALVGASGNIGTHTLSTLVSHGIHTLTVISRPESTSQFPAEVTVKKGGLSDEAFLTEALQGNDVLVLQLSIAAMASQETLIRAAAKAGIKYVLPTEFGSDPKAKMVDMFPMLLEKRPARELISELGMRCIAVVTNPWYDFGIIHGGWKMDIKGRKATLWDGGNAKVNTTSLRRAGEATATLVAMPEDELAGYAQQGCFYVTSFYVSQRDMLESVMRVTKTSESDWNITTPAAVDVVAECDEKMKTGDMGAFMTKFYLTHFREGYGGDINSKVVDLQKFGLEKEDMDAVTAKVVQTVGTS